ncbi:MAG: ABC transporter permease [Lachnospiraceae bacterium]|nr:ABC transporter permease [Lachnospiraceae bacterium]
MFGTLFLKECKQVLRSMVYYIYVVAFVMFLSSQLGGELTDKMEKPVPGQGSYGTIVSHEESVVMGNIMANLVGETENNSYATYPLGFYKRVTLNEEELSQVKEIIENCTGKKWEEIIGEMEEHFSGYDQGTVEGAIQAQMEYRADVKDTLKYEDFCSSMEKVCQLIGAGSSYSSKKLEAGVGAPMSYEQALEEYEVFCREDKVTGATARLFCDYAGIVLSVLPIFLGVTRCLRDRRAQAEQVIFAREASVFQIVGSRYLANVCMAFLPVVFTAFVMQLPYQFHAETLGVAADALAFLKYSFVWLLPEIMAVLAVSFFITELTGGVISIFVQVFWAFASLFSAVGLQGDFALKLIARWNALGNTREFLRQRQELFLNRGFYFGLSVLLLILTFAIYEKKRREGGSIYGKIFKGRK